MSGKNTEVAPVAAPVAVPAAPAVDPSKDFESRSENLRKSLFDNSPVPKKEEETPKEKTPLAPKKAAPVSEEVEEEDEVEEEEEKPIEKPPTEEEGDPEEDEEDYEKPLKSPKKKEEEEYEAPTDESAARKQAKIQGRRAKQLDAELTQVRLDMDKLKADLDVRENRIRELEAVRVNPWQDPEVSKIKDAVWKDIRRGTRSLNSKKAAQLAEAPGQFLEDLIQADLLPHDQYDGAISKIHGRLVELLNDQDVPFEELSSEEQRDLTREANEALKILERNIPDTKRATELAKAIDSKAKSGQIAVGRREYDQRLKEIQPLLDPIGELEDTLIESDPHSPAALVARMVRDSPQGRRRLEKAKEDILLALLGPKALSQRDADQLVANGVDLKSHLKELENVRKSRLSKLIPQLVQGLAMLGSVKEMSSRLAALEEDQDAGESEKEVVRKIGRKPVPRQEAEKPKSIEERRSAMLANLLSKDT